MKLSNLKSAVYSIIIILTSSFTHASESKEGSEGEKFDAKEMIMHHVKDAHAFHFFDWNGKPISLELPIILYDEGLTTFSSGEFHHDDSGSHIVEKGGKQYVKLH